LRARIFVIFIEVLDLNMGKSGNEYEQLISVNEYSVKRHLQGVLEIHEEILAEFVKVNKRQIVIRC